jgi:hypothetical protein
MDVFINAHFQEDERCNYCRHISAGFVYFILYKFNKNLTIYVLRDVIPSAAANIQILFHFFPRYIDTRFSKLNVRDETLATNIVAHNLDSVT